MAKEYRGFKVKKNSVWVKDNLTITMEVLDDGKEVYKVSNDGVERKRTYTSLDAAINGVLKETAPDAEISSIKAARESAGLSRAELEKLIGVPHITLCAWETNRRKCPEWAERLLIAEIERIGDAKKKLGI